MSKTQDCLNPDLREWITGQKIFFVATAPSGEEGHINCSPKGGDTFRILGDHEVAYLDLTGSGIETAAHLQENGRIVIMFCAFDGPPKIVRLHGKGEVIYPGQSEFAGLANLFPAHPGARAVIRVKVTRISDSCGYAVPRLDFVSHRNVLDQWTAKKTPEELAAYRAKKNWKSVDGAPGYQPQRYTDATGG